MKWCGDMTEIPTDEGKLYLAILDLFSRKLLASPTAEHRDAELVGDAGSAAPNSSRRTPLSSLFYRARELGSRRTALSDRVPLVFVPCHAPPQRRCSGATRPPG